MGLLPSGERFLHGIYAKGSSLTIPRHKLLQNLGMILHRENARAVVKRMFPAMGGSQALLDAAATLQAAEAEAETG